MVVITICATKNYCAFMPEQALRVQAATAKEPTGRVVLVGDNSPEFRDAAAYYRAAMLPGWEVEAIHLPDVPEGENYKAKAQITIATMRTAAFARARALRATYCWSLDSDVLPPPNALECLKWALAFDGGFYGVAASPYPSQGGTLFLCGRGTPQQPILPDFYDHEKAIPAKLLKRKKAVEKAKVCDEAWVKEWQEVREAIKQCPPRANVFTLNGEEWQPRGWFDNAYPGIGKGAMVQSDWCGFGCTLLDARALALAHFDGYDGGGTEDLYICWKRWHQHGIRIAAVPHCPSDHISRTPGKAGEYFLAQARHETEGKHVGHLRVDKRPWVPMRVPLPAPEQPKALIHLAAKPAQR